MSYFGDGTLSQVILDEIESITGENSSIEIIKALADIIKYYARRIRE